MRKNANFDNYSSTPLSNQSPVPQVSSQAVPTTQTDLQRAANIPSPTSNGSSELGFPSNRLNSTPFEAGEEAAQNGIILIQLEGATALIYLPDEIQEEQQSSLKEVLEPRQGFEISFTHQGQIYTDDITLDSLMQYTSSYITSSVKMR